ncbi:MAG TPA: ABC transporter permease [Paludibacteraceae bacterium]|nr:ABC transporter permease [Paludibacteraceae bacterium]HOU68342.1 ABC transporter permease [Paludibacteraceae bacterium]HPH62932.1 ABC transporter permease [Paludibacteraceae bacterium]HQF50167.1 ABC transporter permease [Paludibacteraceae bacterium]HQJ89570.1 ABC transporter permease [Paludibacteraceae bacterium]
MNNLFLIIKREYLSRIRRKSFIIMTFVTPLIFLAITVIPTVMLTQESMEERETLVLGDSAGYYTRALQGNPDYIFTEGNDIYFNETNPNKTFFAVINLPGQPENYPNNILLISENVIPTDMKRYIDTRLSEAASLKKLEKASPQSAQAYKECKVEVNSQSIKQYDPNGNSEQNETNTFVAIASAFLIYIFIFSYGTQVMRGVTEEKNNKIMEVMFLSSKPFQFITGKIIGIALVGLTQFLIWAGIAFFIFQFSTESTGAYTEFFSNLEMPKDPSIFTILLFFVLFFLAGYYLYASFFAIIGAMSEPGTDSQQFLMPVTVPIIFAIYAGIYATYQPESQLAVWCSYIPLTSPIVMMARLCHGIDLAEVLLSLGVLAACALFCAYLAGLVYKSAILLHGKKLTYEDLWRFIKG